MSYLNPDYTDKQIRAMVVDQWHLALALNPAVDVHVGEPQSAHEPLRVKYFRHWMQAEGILK